MTPPSKASRGASAARMAHIRTKSLRAVRHSRCVGCHKRLEDHEPLVHCGRRKFLCAPCSNAQRPLRCRNYRRVVADMFGFRVQYADKSALICADCRDTSKRKGLPYHYRGCLQEIAAGEPLVYCATRSYVCAPCAGANQPAYCKGCHRTVTGEYVYLHKYAGNQRNTVCEWCLKDIKAGRRSSRFAAPSPRRL